MKELEDLQKALDNLDIIMMNTTDFGSSVQEAMNIVLNKWSVFRQSQEAKEHAIRKLYEIYKKMCIEVDNHGTRADLNIAVFTWTNEMKQVFAGDFAEDKSSKLKKEKQ